MVSIIKTEIFQLASSPQPQPAIRGAPKSKSSGASKTAKPILGELLEKAKVMSESFPLLEWPYLPVLCLLGMLLFLNLNFGCPDDDDLDTYSKFVYHVAVCGGPGSKNFHLGKNERIVQVILAVIGVFGYVIPKHMKQDGAKRLYVSGKVTRVLLVHIISGLTVVLGSGLMGIFAGGIHYGSPMFWFLGIADMIHEITIVRLLKNHDGIFALRVDNAAAGFAKFQALINCYRYSPASIADVWFLASWGFMGTRIAGVLSYIIMFFSKDGDSIYLEHTYSIGVSLAIFHIVGRAHAYGVQIWLIIAPVVCWLYYHELWSRRTKARFVGTMLFGSLFMLKFGNGYTQFVYMVAFHGYCFTQPIFYRLPKLALGGTLEGEKKAQLSTDPGLRAVYLREELVKTKDSRSFRMQKADASMKEHLPEDHRAGLNFRGATGWVPGDSYHSSSTQETDVSSSSESENDSTSGDE